MKAYTHTCRTCGTVVKDTPQDTEWPDGPYCARILCPRCRTWWQVERRAGMGYYIVQVHRHPEKQEQPQPAKAPTEQYNPMLEMSKLMYKRLQEQMFMGPLFAPPHTVNCRSTVVPVDDTGTLLPWPGARYDKILPSWIFRSPAWRWRDKEPGVYADRQLGQLLRDGGSDVAVLVERQLRDFREMAPRDYWHRLRTRKEVMDAKLRDASAAAGPGGLQPPSYPGPWGRGFIGPWDTT